MLCCCFRFRIPRTKQEIEADYQRRVIAKSFRERLRNIKNSEMDNMNLQLGEWLSYRSICSLFGLLAFEYCSFCCCL